MHWLISYFFFCYCTIKIKKWKRGRSTIGSCGWLQISRLGVRVPSSSKLAFLNSISFFSLFSFTQEEQQHTSTKNLQQAQTRYKLAFSLFLRARVKRAVFKAQQKSHCLAFFILDWWHKALQNILLYLLFFVCTSLQFFLEYKTIQTSKQGTNERNCKQRKVPTDNRDNTRQVMVLTQSFVPRQAQKKMTNVIFCL